ncbi:hypothetical protein [Dinoroseobacter sp. S76]|uniref:hypothetical protein n=1 Tax=Dinoroseobacter sp. S76 TaxID=3415124 RepID=UPI003C7CF692
MLKWIDARVEALEDMIEERPGRMIIYSLCSGIALLAVLITVLGWVSERFGTAYHNSIVVVFFGLAFTCLGVTMKAMHSIVRRWDSAHRAKYIVKRPK